MTSSPEGICVTFAGQRVIQAHACHLLFCTYALNTQIIGNEPKHEANHEELSLAL